MKLVKLLLKVLATLVVLLAAVLAIGPFLIPVSPLDSLASPRELAGTNDRFITLPFAGTDGIDIRYTDTGALADPQAPTFILLHGSLLNAASWRAITERLGAYGRVIAYDQPPYGLSEKLRPDDWTGADPYAPASAIAQLVALIDALDLNNVVLVGNSYGGRLAVDAALQNPTAFDALILVDAAVYAREEMPGWLLELPQIQHLGPLLARWLGSNRDFYAAMYADPARIDATQTEATFIATGVRNWDFALWAYLSAWQLADISPRLSELDLPVLVVSGDSDAIVPVAESQKLGATSPNAEFALLRDCGHLPQEECPNALMDVVEAWLAGL